VIVCTIRHADQKSATLGGISCEVALRGAMKASVRIVLVLKLVLKFEFTSCLAQTWVLECDVVRVLKRAGLWTSTTHEVRS
jgi:hypothetical protein